MRAFHSRELGAAIWSISRRLSYNIGNLWLLGLEQLILQLHFILGVDVHLKKKSVLLTILAFYIMKNPCIEAHNR